jgi:hypothetical protein
MLSSDYLHAPFLDPAVYLEALRLLEPKPQPRALRMPARRLSAREEALRGQETAVAHAAWTERGFNDVERDVWIEAGIRRHDAHIAEQCVRFGVTPAMLALEVQGRKARFWLRSGESVAAVRARLLEEGVEVA